MDPMALLDSNIPFDENKLNLLDNIVNTFYSTKNENDRSMANKLLNEFKLNSDSWMYCDFILTKSNSILTKIIALGILEDVIKAKWLSLPPDQRLGIRNFLVDILIKHVTDEQNFNSQTHYINKLNYIIVLVSFS
jgi:exportin-1